MKKYLIFFISTASIFWTGLFLSQKSSATTTDDSQPIITIETVEQLIKEVSNWGRWGPDDQLGTLNLITPSKRKQAASLIQEGITISLSRDMKKQSDTYTQWPLMQSMQYQQNNNMSFIFDMITVSYHGLSHSHLDALGHLFYKGKSYNGVTMGDAVKSTGLEKLSVQTMKDGIVSRGVLIDIPLIKEQAYLESGESISIDDLERWEKHTGVTVGPGDVVLIYTGRWARQKVQGNGPALAGLDSTVARWLRERDVAVLGSDGISDAIPTSIEGLSPVHILTLSSMGMPLLDNLDLEKLAKKAVMLTRWEFYFMVAPLRIPGGTGSPVNPIAVF